MNILAAINLLELFLHLDRYLSQALQEHGLWVYPILFLIIFCETGLVVTPFLPGDSLLFAAGSIMTAGSLRTAGLLFVILSVAAILGDTLNYWIGAKIGPRVFHKEKSRWFNPRHLQRTHKFYEKYGPETIIIARFVPIIRTFAPFVAGIGKMTYLRFLSYNVLGGILWVAVFIFGGFFFGNLPIVKNHFSIVIIAIIIISLIPAVIEFIRQYRKKPDNQ